MNPRNPFNYTHEVELNDVRDAWRERKVGDKEWSSWHPQAHAVKEFWDHMVENKMWGAYDVKFKRIK